MPSTDPGFSHGTDFGYRNGCTDHATCPATPTCVEAHDRYNERRRTQTNDAPGEAKTFWLLRRVRQTLDVVGPADLRAYAGVSHLELEYVLSETSRTIAFDLAERLDAAWAWFVHGSDVRDPKFPHGLPGGYVRYCRCRHCTDAVAKSKARERLGIRHERAGVSPEVLAKVGRHVERLLKQGNMVQIARAAGISPTRVNRAKWGMSISTISARALLATTPAQVRAATSANSLIPVDETRHFVRTMWALGYPLTWQADQVGEDRRDFARIGMDRDMITVRRAEAIAELAARIGDLPPSDDLGIDPVQIKRARSAARKAGWYPPAAYDDDRNLDPRAIPGNVYEKADEWAMRRLTALHELARGMSINGVARMMGMDDETVRTRLRHGLTYEGSGRSMDTKASAPRIRQVMDVWHAVETAEYGPVMGALILDIHPRDYYVLKAWKDHPEVLAWLATQEAETTAPAAGETAASTHREAA